MLPEHHYILTSILPFHDLDLAYEFQTKVVVMHLATQPIIFVSLDASHELYSFGFS